MRLRATLPLLLPLAALAAALPARGEDNPGALASEPAPVSSASPLAAPAKGVLTVEIDPASVLSDDPDHLFKHSYFGDRFWFSGQVNFLFQSHPGFLSEYSGPHSLRSGREAKLSEVATLYFGIRLFSYTEILCDAENAAGKGLSDALGLAGFTDVDVVRNPDLGAEPYLARLMLHQTIPLSDEMVENPNYGPQSIRHDVPARRIELRIGKMSLADFFDANGPGSDSHFQFTSWTTVQNGAWDYAADTRGYTYAAMVELEDPIFAVRFLEAAMPKVANGIDIDWQLNHSHAENLELELHGKPFGEREGAVRLLLYENFARMGSYRSTLYRYFSGIDPAPDVTATRRNGRTKRGIGLNFEQELTEWLRVFGRLGFNDGKNESFAYTECENTAELGFDVRGDLWNRERDHFGAAVVSNGLTTEHRRYLANGGLGFLLGDGNLRYGRETTIECYYTVRLPWGISFGPTYQHIWNPGYNRDRGPVDMFGFRFHIEI